MEQYELKFLDGPGRGRSIHVEVVPLFIWLRRSRKGRYWTFREPASAEIEARYKIQGQAAFRLGGGALVVYGVDDDAD